VQVTYLTSPHQAFYRLLLLLFGQIPNIVCTFARNDHHQFLLSEQHESVRALVFSLNSLIWLKTFSDVGIDLSHSDVHLQTIHIAMWVKKSNHMSGPWCSNIAATNSTLRVGNHQVGIHQDKVVSCIQVFNSAFATKSDIFLL